MPADELELEDGGANKTEEASRLDTRTLFGGLEDWTIVTGDDPMNDDDDDEKMICSASVGPGYTVRVSAALMTSW